jgi:hypothetical protein
LRKVFRKKPVCARRLNEALPKRIEAYRFWLNRSRITASP